MIITDNVKQLGISECIRRELVPGLLLVFRSGHALTPEQQRSYPTTTLMKSVTILGQATTNTKLVRFRPLSLRKDRGGPLEDCPGTFDLLGITH